MWKADIHIIGNFIEQVDNESNKYSSFLLWYIILK